MQSTVSYATTDDGVRIAYTCEGDGPVLLRLEIPFWAHVQYPSVNPAEVAWLTDLGVGRRMVRFDFRGVGLSQRDITELPPDADVRDIAAVVDGLGVARCDLWAEIDASIPAIRYAARFPDRVRHLVLWNPALRVADFPGYDSVRALEAIVATDWVEFTETMQRLFAPPGRAREWAIAFRGGIDARCYQLWSSAMHAWDAAPDAPSVSVPALVFAGETRNWVSLQPAARVANALKGSDLVVLPGGIRDPWDLSPSVVPAVREFLGRDSSTDGVRSDAPIESAGPSASSASQRSLGSLSSREIEVLRLVATGKSNAQIAEALFISPSTVARHVSHILEKTGAANRSEAAVLAVRKGLTA